jgi:Ca-activated chloride channel family protein
MNAAFTNPWLLSALLALPALAVLGAFARAWRQQAAGEFGGPVLGARLVRLAPGWLRGTCLVLGLTLLGLGMAGPRWGRDWGQSAAPGRDLMVVLDLSRSMYAEAPSRVGQAREALLGLAEGLRRQGGHRVGLVVFAGSPKVVCPLTHDLDYFRAAVEAIDPDVMMPGLGSGTRIGTALETALEAFEGRGREACDVLLVSEGADPARADGEFLEGAKRATALKVRVYCLAVGDPNKDRTIPGPGPDGVQMYKDRPVLTRMQEAPLRLIASRTGGQMERLGAGPIDLAAYYRQWSRDAARADSPDTLPAYHQRQEWFLWPAFALLALFLWLPAVPEDRP